MRGKGPTAVTVLGDGIRGSTDRGKHSIAQRKKQGPSVFVEQQWRRMARADEWQAVRRRPLQDDGGSSRVPCRTETIDRAHGHGRSCGSTVEREKEAACCCQLETWSCYWASWLAGWLADYSNLAVVAVNRFVAQPTSPTACVHCVDVQQTGKLCLPGWLLPDTDTEKRTLFNRGTGH